MRSWRKRRTRRCPPIITRESVVADVDESIVGVQPRISGRPRSLIPALMLSHCDSESVGGTQHLCIERDESGSDALGNRNIHCIGCAQHHLVEFFHPHPRRTKAPPSTGNATPVMKFAS